MDFGLESMPIAYAWGVEDSDRMSSMEDLWNVSAVVGSTEGLKEVVLTIFRWISKMFHKLIELISNIINKFRNKSQPQHPTPKLDQETIKNDEAKEEKKKELLDRKQKLEEQMDAILAEMNSVPIVPKEESTIWRCFDILEELIKDFKYEAQSQYGYYGMDDKTSTIRQMADALKSDDSAKISEHFKPSYCSKKSLIFATNEWNSGGETVQKLLNKSRRVLHEVDNFKFTTDREQCYVSKYEKYAKENLPHIKELAMAIQDFSIAYLKQFNKWRPLKIKGNELHWELIGIVDQLNRLER